LGERPEFSLLIKMTIYPIGVIYSNSSILNGTAIGYCVGENNSLIMVF
jgi:hypothetical protein